MYKLIATDLDGTFLDENSSFDAPRFWRVYDRMRAAGCRFALASGDQYYCMRNYFGPRGGELSYVAENGAWVRAEGERDLYCCSIPRTLWQPVAAALRARDDTVLLVCGKQSAYAPTDTPAELYRILGHYYPALCRQDDLDAITDDILKLCLLVPPEKTAQYHEELTAGLLPAGITATTGGNGCLDLIAAGQHKESGLRRLLAEYGIRPEECAAFGDSGNDLEMLRFVGQSWAVANAAPEVKAAAKALAPANSEGGVLQILEQLFPE